MMKMICSVYWIELETNKTNQKGKNIYHCCCNCCANNNREERERENIIVACSATAIIIIIDTFIIMGELELLLKQNNDHVDNQWMREREKKWNLGRKKDMHAQRKMKYKTALHASKCTHKGTTRPAQVGSSFSSMTFL